MNINNNTSYLKYLKYKNKYLNLKKNLIGGHPTYTVNGVPTYADHDMIGDEP